MTVEAPVTCSVSTDETTALPALRERYLGQNVREIEHDLRESLTGKTVEIIAAGEPIDFEIRSERCRVIHDSEGAVTDIRFG